MPSLFRRKPAESESDSDTTTAPEAPKAKGHTPSKRELGKSTPKRPEMVRRTAEAPPADRREAAKRMREKQRVERAEARAGMLRGEEKYLLPRDRGPERALVRDVVDSRRTIGTWFFGLTFVVMLIGFNRSLNPSIYLAANLLFLLFALATAVDSYLITRRIRKLIAERFPNPKPRVKPGAEI